MKEPIEIKSPCSEEWEKMAGGEGIRHCSKCRFNVFNFAEMTQEEIDNLLKSGDKLCVRLYVRPDGTYMTKDCRSRIKRNRFLKFFGMAALLPFSLALFKSDGYTNTIDKARRIPVFGEIINKLNPQPRIIMGEKMCPAPPKTTIRQ